MALPEFLQQKSIYSSFTDVHTSAIIIICLATIRQFFYQRLKGKFQPTSFIMEASKIVWDMVIWKRKIRNCKFGKAKWAGKSGMIKLKNKMLKQRLTAIC